MNDRDDILEQLQRELHPSMPATKNSPVSYLRSVIRFLEHPRDGGEEKEIGFQIDTGLTENLKSTTTNIKRAFPGIGRMNYVRFNHETHRRHTWYVKSTEVNRQKLSELFINFDDMYTHAITETDPPIDELPF